MGEQLPEELIIPVMLHARRMQGLVYLRVALIEGEADDDRVAFMNVVCAEGIDGDPAFLQRLLRKDIFFDIGTADFISAVCHDLRKRGHTRSLDPDEMIMHTRHFLFFFIRQIDLFQVLLFCPHRRAFAKQ